MVRMKTEGLFIESPVPAAAMTMKNLWVVNADKTYNVNRENKHLKDYTLIRTLKGCGHITLKNNQNFFLSANSILLVYSSGILNYHTENPLWEFSWFEFSGVPPLPFTIVQHPFSDIESAILEELKKRMRQPGSKNSATASAILTSLIHIWSIDIETASSKQRIKVHKLIEFMHNNLKKTYL